MIQKEATEPEKERNMRSAIVGCGNVAQVHAKAIAGLEDSVLVAVADICVAKAEEMAKQYDAKAYESFEEMLQAEQIDVLHICTPHYLHVPMAIRALQAGVHVFMEKPPVIDRKQWEALKKVVQETAGKARLGLCFQNRYNDSVQYVRKQLKEGVYGNLLGIRGMVTWNRGMGYYRSNDWRGKLATEGGGALINQAIHTLDLMQYFVDEKPISVKSSVAKLHLPEEIEVEDMVAAHIVYPAARGSFFVTTGYVTDAPPLIELECEKARVRIEEDVVTVFRGEEAVTQGFSEQKRLGKSHWGMGHQTAIQEFYTCVTNNDKYAIELEDVEETIWLLLEIYGR